MGKPVIAVDFDGVLHNAAQPIPGRRMGMPIRGAFEAMTLLRDHGYEVIVFTAQKRIGHIRDWLDFYRIPYNEVTHEKPMADVYVDDKCVKFVTWPQVIQDISNRRLQR
jgi:hypothetical protein